MTGELDTSCCETDSKTDDTAKRPRQDTTVIGATGIIAGHTSNGTSPIPTVHRKHDASSTIQRTRPPNEWPACAAISGTRDVGVMPGWVLISSQITSPSSQKRSS